MSWSVLVPAIVMVSPEAVTDASALDPEAFAIEDKTH